MSKQTLSLKNKPATEPAIVAPSEITAEQVLEWLKKNGTPVSPPEPGAIVTTAPAPASADFDWKYDAPIEKNPFDLSKLNQQNSRSVPVSVPAKMWGNPRLLTSP